jgi:DNA polymerase III alpha subunit
LDEIKNLSCLTIERIRTRRPFMCAEDFFYSVRPSTDEGVALIKSGALDSFGYSRPQLHLMLLLFKNPRHNTPEFYEHLPALKDISTAEKRNHQLKILNFIPECHVLELYYPLRRIKIEDVTAEQKTDVIGTPVARKVMLTKNKKLMSFVTIDDETATLEVVLFPGKYKKGVIGPVIRVQGTIHDGSLIAESCTPLPVISTPLSTTASPCSQ